MENARIFRHEYSRINTNDPQEVAVPCPAKWEQMYAVDGNRVCFCSQCNLNVYNLSEMSREQADR